MVGYPIAVNNNPSSWIYLEGSQNMPVASHFHQDTMTTFSVSLTYYQSPLMSIFKDLLVLSAPLIVCVALCFLACHYVCHSFYYHNKTCRPYAVIPCTYSVIFLLGCFFCRYNKCVGYDMCTSYIIGLLAHGWNDVVHANGDYCAHCNDQGLASG